MEKNESGDEVSEMVNQAEGIGFVNRRLTVTSLKLIAILAMFIDHFAAIVLTSLQSVYGQSLESFFWFQLVIILIRLIGRIAFPIFAYLIVNGFYHTSNKKKYFLRLALFAVISEPFFDFGISGSFVDMSHQNVFFTLGLGLLAIWGYDHISRDESKNFIPGLFIVALGFLAQMMQTDYGFYGIMTIFVMYLFFDNFKRLSLMLIILNVLLYGGQLSVITSLMSDHLGNGYEVGLQVIYFLMCNAQLFSLFSLIFLKDYNGQKGRPFNKYMFYVFYPVHLFLLGLLVLGLQTFIY